ncbi:MULTISPECIES: exopolysaccharide biosynthesis protein [unclassified Roseitalea]|uniref:exopolysaccharide biosynthesis protein n=1 Tax=unclassified Roseitalea TaxID=2639107 RepID=UPI00320906BB
MAQAATLTDIVDELEQANAGQAMSVSEMVGAFGSRGFGALLGAPALISISPLGALPGASFVIAFILILIGGQFALGRTQPWLPGYFERLTVDADKVDAATAKMRSWTRRIDRVLAPRLQFMVSRLGDRLMAAASVILAISFFPVILIPWAVVIPSLIILPVCNGDRRTRRAERRAGLGPVPGLAVGVLALHHGRDMMDIDNGETNAWKRPWTDGQTRRGLSETAREGRVEGKGGAYCQRTGKPLAKAVQEGRKIRCLRGMDARRSVRAGPGDRHRGPFGDVQGRTDRRAAQPLAVKPAGQGGTSRTWLR